MRPEESSTNEKLAARARHYESKCSLLLLRGKQVKQGVSCVSRECQPCVPDGQCHRVALEPLCPGPGEPSFLLISSLFSPIHVAPLQNDVSACSAVRQKICSICSTHIWYSIPQRNFISD